MQDRQRPTGPRPSAYITPAGQQALVAELRHLWKEKRPDVTRRVAEAAAMGDRSENAEYIYGKKQLREIDRRVRFLSKRLDELTVITRKPPDQSKVYFGAWVTLETATGEQRWYRLVGPDELDLSPEYISIDSMLARALLKHAQGAEVSVDSPGGSASYRITAVNYDRPPIAGTLRGSTDT